LLFFFFSPHNYKNFIHHNFAFLNFQSSMDAVLRVIAPPPLSPYFQAGGPLEGLNEDVCFTLLLMAVLFVVDTLLVRPLIQPKARYFALHVVANAISAIASFNDVYKVFAMGNPTGAFSGPSSTMVANSAVAAIHLYHCVAFPLRAEDIFHHVTFVSVLCGLAIPLKHHGGSANNFGCFFLSGLPGGLNYVLLVCVAHGWMDKMTEKRWAARINVWMRGPSMSVYLFLGILSYLHDEQRQVHAALLAIVVALHFHNGQYYAQQAVESLATHVERRRAVKEAKS
jgi:hypothetical protein